MPVKRVRADEPGRHMDLPGGRLFVDTAGREPEGAFPLVLLIHGAGMDHRVWNEVAYHLGAHATSVLNVDLPGHGQTGGEPLETIAGQASLIAELISVSDQGVASVVGHSMGGLIAIELAATRPELVDRLVVVGAGAAMPVSDRLLDAAAHDLGTANGLLDRWSHSRSAGDAPREVTRSIRAATPPGVLHTALVACDRYEDGRLRAAAVQAPSLVIIGEDDVMVSKAEVDNLVAALPNVRVVEIADAGHDTMVDAPGDVIDAIERFLAGQPSSS